MVNKADPFFILWNKCKKSYQMILLLMLSSFVLPIIALRWLGISFFWFCALHPGWKNVFFCNLRTINADKFSMFFSKVCNGSISPFFTDLLFYVLVCVGSARLQVANSSKVGFFVAFSPCSRQKQLQLRVINYISLPWYDKLCSRHWRSQ